jgi:Ribbon-helix-helix protein, copG family
MLARRAGVVEERRRPSDSGLRALALQVAGDGWYIGFMLKKTSIYLEAEVDRALDRRAVAEGTTKAALIRLALAAAVAPAVRPRPRACGVFDGPEDLAREADRHLTQSGFGER